MIRDLVTSLMLLCVSATAIAADTVGDWYVNPYVGGIKPGTEWNGDGNSFLYGFDIGKNLTEHWNAEFDFNHTRFSDRNDSGHTTLSGIGLDGLYVFNRPATFAPYLSLGLGATHSIPPGSSDSDFMLQGGAGAFIRLWENSDGSRSFALRPDLKARWTNGHGNPVDFLYVLGFTFAFGPAKAAATVASAAPPPPPPPPPAPPPPPQSRCPGTPPGVAVDEFGCPVKGDVILQGVNFETDSSVLTGGSKPILDNVAKGLREHPRLVVEVQGHTDSTGSPKYNRGLSERRANAVRDYLMSQGVSGSQLTAKGYGESQPVASNATPDGRAQNRRVVMHVVSNPGDVTIRKEGQAQQ